MGDFNAIKLKEFTTSEAKKIVEEKDYDRLIVICYNERGYENEEIDYEWGVTTYSKDKNLCEKTGKIGEELAKGFEYFLHKEKKED